MSELKKHPHRGEFEQAAGERRTHLITDIFGFIRENGKWWLFPILLVFVLAGTLVLLTATPAAPFIYTLF